MTTAPGSLHRTGIAGAASMLLSFSWVGSVGQSGIIGGRLTPKVKSRKSRALISTTISLSLISIQHSVNNGHHKTRCDTPDSSLRILAVASYL
ncbi:hypothetical protein C7974DRAFT_155766 [Boeremia exigua]|uniref:uncharacterized protein n=1 Tax=Boeremia exigua TaxID=749465 RepID=UPI001E8EB9FA|nr:uncharacterized protein C7974DRAFT_155766 [Boeremia exigua]KAH6638173.1 hypothetical protein C7974DRAFT_155766 [Boeremia exigua]